MTHSYTIEHSYSLICCFCCEVSLAMFLCLSADALALKWHHKFFPISMTSRKSTADSQLTRKEVGGEGLRGPGGLAGTNDSRRKAVKESYRWDICESQVIWNKIIQKKEHLFIMFLTLKAMRGHFWESCQMGVTHKSGECDKTEWIWIYMWTWTASRLFYCHCLFKCALQWRKTGKNWLLCWMWNWCSLVSPILLW